MVLPNNMGMYAEEIVNRTCDYCLNNNVNLYIEKRHLPIKITRKINENTILGKLLSKSTVDYFGSYKNIFFQFETKQTNNTYFSLSLFKEHQLKALEKFSKNNSVIFAIVYFEKNEKFYILNASWILNQKMNKISLEKIQKECEEINMIYPGILDIEFFKKYLEKVL